MKNIWIIGLLSMVLVSCQFTEELYLNRNGSGTYSFKVDMSALSQMRDFSDNDSIKEKKYQKLDTVFNIADYLQKHKDSINKMPEDEKSLVQSLSGFRVHTFIDEEEGKSFFEILYDFNDLSELRDIDKQVEKVSTLNLKRPAGTDKFNRRMSRTEYYFTGRKFERKSFFVEDYLKNKEEYSEGIKKSIKSMAGSPYTIIYHFPRRIKKISYRGAEISPDGKTLKIVTTVDSIMLYPKKYDFTVKLRRK